MWEDSESQELEPQEIELPPTRRERLRARWASARVRLRKLTPVVLGVAITLLALIIYNLINPGPPILSQKDVDTRVARAMASATPKVPDSTRVYAQLQPSLVEIVTTEIGKDGKQEGGRGTGVIIDEGGSILTSLHVVASAIDIEVIFGDGTKSGAIIGATQPENDIALIKATAPPDRLTPAILGDPKSLSVGDEAFAIGNPFGLTGSESAGIISGLNRTYQPPGKDFKMQGMIQFDAAVNPGNSGGPLVNRDGEVVGIVTGLLNPTDQNFFVGIGFAVPIDVAAASGGSPQY